MAARKKIAIVGGSFDPPTEQHFNVAAAVAQTGSADEVWMCPCGPRPDKPSLKTPSLIRYMLCVLGIEGKFSAKLPIKVCDIEVFEKQSIPTYFCIKKLEEKFPDYDFFWVIGTDLVDTLKDWDEGEKLWNECGFLLYPRVGYEAKELPPKCVHVEFKDAHKHLSICVSDFSSTEVRKRLKTGDVTMAEGLVPPVVLSYIYRNGLYDVDCACPPK